MTRWRVWIDRGGTFTDAIAIGPDGAVRAGKVASSDAAPVIAIRALLGLDDAAPVPPVDVRLGTTLATNALLERRGAPTALVITRGFADLLALGDQTRRELFALDIAKLAPVTAVVVEVDARLDAAGGLVAWPGDAALDAIADDLAGRGIESIAIAVIHASAAPAREQAIADRFRARLAGRGIRVAASTEVASEQGLLARTDTAVADAYLSPVIARHLDTLAGALPGSRIEVMKSSGGLAASGRFRGRDAVVSGPAGGVIALAVLVRRHGLAAAIGLDMGGTSTDVTWIDGAGAGGALLAGVERVHEAEVAGVRLKAPMLAIHTVAAGGGSLCRWDGLRLTVGPASAGADPGPLCYGRAAAREPAISDADLVLGRLAADRFPLGLDAARAEAGLAALAARMGQGGGDAATAASAASAASACVAVADAAMAEAIRRVSIARGRDPRGAALIAFGGAAAAHACAVAGQLGIATVIVPPYPGVLSAWGLGHAAATWHGEADAGGVELGAGWDRIAALVDDLVARGRAALGTDDASAHAEVELRYAGADAAVSVPIAADAAATAERFAAMHRDVFGYDRDGAAVEAAVVRVELEVPAEPVVETAWPDRPPAVPVRTQGMWSGGREVDARVYLREALGRGASIDGPAVIVDDTATIVVDVGWGGRVLDDGSIQIEHEIEYEHEYEYEYETESDAVGLEVWGNRFMSIAEQMGDGLRRTAVSVNIRERRDFSCAIFDGAGGLVANAPHIPVHLGAMGETIRSLLRERAIAPGQVYASNDPDAGGSHLPDLTVITPVFHAGALAFFTASRGHHADVGGTTPGSMPPFSQTLADEGCVLRHVAIVDAGRFDEAGIRAALAGARRIDDNVADLAAQVAANQLGARLVGAAIDRDGPAVLAYMRHVQDHAAALVAREIARLDPRPRRFTDSLDDGTPIAVAVRVDGGRLIVDFTGTGGVHPGNLNAPRAVTVAAVLYVLRCLVGAPIPLNAGCLAPVELVIPPGSLLDPGPGRAVCGGNVETSQRIVDVLLGALGVAAASQGTMNNVTLGDGARAYYETIAGGAGATARAPGASAVHTHMTNTRITDPEVLEARFPVRVRRHAIRTGSGGAGRHRGGDGVIRELELLAPMQVSILSERRSTAPFGLAGGAPGAPGDNRVGGISVGGKVSQAAAAGTVVSIETPGGGGFEPA